MSGDTQETCLLTRSEPRGGGKRCIRLQARSVGAMPGSARPRAASKSETLAAVLMRSAAILFFALASACGPSAAPLQPATDGTTIDATTIDTTGELASQTGALPTSATTEDSTSITASTAGTTLHDFATSGDGPVDLPDCDPFGQDCPVGQKCVPWDEQGGNTWNGARCVEITGDGAPGDPCTAPEGPVAGVDDCALGSICWNVDEQNHGVCVAQCLGSVEAPTCPPKHGCILYAELYLDLCFPSCFPAPDDCPEDRICIPYQQSFFCEEKGPEPGAQTNESCSASRCAKGLACLDASDASSACDDFPDGSCCQPYCEFPGGTCPNPDQQCLPWHDPMWFVPPGYENLGYCGIAK